LAFFAGVGIAAVPTVGPFLAIIAFLTGRLQFQRADFWWWLAALFLGVPYLLTGHPAEAGLTIVQILAVWIIYRAATEFRRNIHSATVPRDIGAGLVVGLGITLALGLRQAGEFRFDVAKTALDAITWTTHPALFGHAILVLSALVALVVPSPRLRVVAMGLGAVGVIFSGSLEAVISWLVIAISLRFLGRRGTTSTRFAEWTLIGIMVLIASGVAALLGLGRTGFATEFIAVPNANQFRGTEVLNGDWWHPLGVRSSESAVEIDGQQRTAITLTKDWIEPWSRLQQAVTLEPGQTYTLSAALKSSPPGKPGFDGWGRASAHVEAVNLGTTIDGDTHRFVTSGAITVLSATSVTLPDDWRRAYVTFRYEGDQPLTWYVGVVPERSWATGVQTTFAELQLTATNTLLPYRPGPAATGVTDLRTTRLPIWRDAVAAITARPLLGWGPQGFPAAVSALHPDEAHLRPVAAHAHNAVLDAWVDRGFFGALGLLGLLAMLSLRAVQQRDRAAVVVLIGVVILNTFDSTLLTGPVIYPLAAVLGWRAVGHREAAQAETGLGSATAVRATLAIGDVLAGASALSLGFYVASFAPVGSGPALGWTLSLAYATLFWPAMAAASGLYPGYGRPSYQELGRLVRSAAAATVLIGFATLLMPGALHVSALVLVVTLVATAVLAPLFRALAKLLLRRLRLWGRPVAMLGTDQAAMRVARHLLSNSGLGLLPVAAFGSTEGWDVPGLEPIGPLSEAWNYLDRQKIRHAIVAPEAAATAGFDQVLLRAENQLTYVQYLPDLRGLPTNSVAAVPLGTTLALEARNQLASRTNRALKRVVDLIGSIVLLVLLFVPMAVITLLVWLDTRESPLYLSTRLGRYGKVFKCIKFRTMYFDADNRLERLLETHPEMKAEYETYHKLEEDPRVTRTGNLLRRLSLDELPQLLNVFRGHMSLVGPRPYMVREHKIMGTERELIFLARPGMTGYWQTEARNDVSFEERQSMEAHYVRNWSIWWDIDILLRTPSAMIGKTGK